MDIIKFFFPPKCIFCGNILYVNSDIDICRSCFENIPFINGIFERKTLKQACSGCDYVICVCRYTGIIKESLIKYKFFNKSSFYRTFAGLLADRIRKIPDCAQLDFIISVPLHKHKESTRGYNQSLLISRQLSRVTGVPERSMLLSRTKDTNSQSLLARDERQHNVKDAFKVNDVSGVKGRNILLVDDILTTGYTLDECSRTLKEAGAKAVIGAVIATGRKL